jgi:hypothetical protein
MSTGTLSTKDPHMARFISKSITKETAIDAMSDGEAVHGESTASGAFVTAVTGVASNSAGIGAGVLGESKGKGPGVVGKAIKDAGVIGFRGDPALGETTVSNDAGSSGVFGASDSGAGVLGYSRNPASWAVYAFGGFRAIALGRPFAGEFVGDVSVDGDVLLTGADCAEQFDVDHQNQPIEPGTVLVIGADGILCQSEQAYDTRVAGVVAGAGTYRPGIILDKQQTTADRLSISLLGKVFCKVDGSCGTIEPGDLLTTSHTPGHAMKVTDPKRAFGAVIGKALKPWFGGTGLIPILVALR